MIKSLIAALALALIGSASEAQVFSPTGRVDGTAIYNPTTGTYCTSAAPCNIFASSGGGSAAAQTTSNNTDGQATSSTNQAAVVYQYLFNGTSWDRARGTGGAANVAVQNFPSNQSVQGSGTAGTPAGGVLTIQGAPGGTPQPVSVASGQDVVEGTTGDTAYAGSGATTLVGASKGIYNALVAPTPSGTAFIGYTGMRGVDQNAAAQNLSTDTQGALRPARATPTTGSIVSVAASTSIAVRASANANSIGFQLRTESANSAPIYVCYTATTTCSATVHDDIIPVSTAIGASLTPLYPITSTIYVFSTAATSLSATEWALK